LVGDIIFVISIGFSMTAFDGLPSELDSSLDLSLGGAMESVESGELVSGGVVGV
jgi:hypothetical protein